MIDITKYPEGFITQEELDRLSKVTLMNKYILVKPLPVSTEKIKIVTPGQNNRLEEKKATKGVVMKVADQVDIDIKEGDITGWSSNGAFYRIIEVEGEVYLGLTEIEIFYKC